MGEGEDLRPQAQECLVPQVLLQFLKPKAMGQWLLPSLRLPQLGGAGLRLAPRLGLNFLRWGEGRSRNFFF